MARVERTDPDGVDFGWVMQATFVLTIVVGAPLVAVLSLSTRLPDWGSRALFAVRVGALVWFCSAVFVYAYARWYREDEDDETGDQEAGETRSGNRDATDGPTDPSSPDEMVED